MWLCGVFPAKSAYGALSISLVMKRLTRRPPGGTKKNACALHALVFVFRCDFDCSHSNAVLACLVLSPWKNSLLCFHVNAHSTQILLVHWQVSLVYYHTKNQGLRDMTNTLIRRWKANMNVLFAFWVSENPFKQVVATDSVEDASYVL